jgi:hypothetical protein
MVQLLRTHLDRTLYKAEQLAQFIKQFDGLRRKTRKIVRAQGFEKRSCATR